MAVPLELDPSKKYKIEYTGVSADDETAPSDVVLHGILFQTEQSALGISTVTSEEQCERIYTIYGIPVNTPADRLPKGIYIINGKKMAVR